MTKKVSEYPLGIKLIVTSTTSPKFTSVIKKHRYSDNLKATYVEYCSTNAEIENTASWEIVEDLDRRFEVIDTVSTFTNVLSNSIYADKI